ncbi:hypothetical protein ACLESD_01035 [Pyxidicoccus sp. 3LFB2]
MSPGEIRELCRAVGYPLRDGAFEVPTYGDRSQKLRVGDVVDGVLRIVTTVVRPARAREAELSHLACWERNRLSELVGLRMGSRGEVLAEVWVPVAGLTPELFKVYIEQLALTGDRLEHQLSGEDEN